jgi:cytidylate kinase
MLVVPLRAVTIVTLSAPYGAGGAAVGPRLAGRLGVAFVDRAIPREVAQRLAVPLEEAARHDESTGSVLERLVRMLAPVGVAYGARPMVEQEIIGEHSYRDATEQVIREQAAGGAVILGRAGALVLRDAPGALHVRLCGPRERRLEYAMRLEGVDREEAERRLRDTDRAREAYVQHFYGADPRDLAHYHLAVDATAIGIDACVEAIATAALARARSAPYER